MKFSEMTEILNDNTINFETIFDFEVNALRYNSKDVEQNDIFFAIKGYKTDGNQFITNAFENGAKAVFTDSQHVITDPRIFRVVDCRKTMAELSNKFYGFPSQKMKMIGITGTNGKTTISSLINFVLQSAGKKTGLIGTNGNYINKRFIKTEHTTPESVDLNKLLSEMVNEGVEYATMEVSSHSLALNRVYGIEFDVILFTNLTPDHLDFHKSMDEYFKAKKILFDSAKRINSKGCRTAAIYNCDDEYGEKIASSTEGERIGYGFGCGAYTAKNLVMGFDGMRFDVLVPRNGDDVDKIRVKTCITGRFNAYNILASIAALKSAGINYKSIVESIKDFKPVDGRFNQLTLQNNAIAIIDYSHTPDSLYKALITIREILDENKSKGKIITVFGCGGNRDKAKRPLMGKIASENSDEVIITSDNPRDEEPIAIIDEIITGIEKNNFSVEENRELAIKKAVEMSSKGDIILVAGKGHETYQEIKGVKYHLSDKEIVENYC